MKPAPPEFTGTGRYLDLRRIGAGGMGVVYQAFDSQRGMKVALKTLPELNPDAIYRFKQEFRALADLVHPNLCPLYELTSDGGRWFFTMELLDDAVEFFPKVRVWSSSVKGFNPPPDSTAGPAAGDVTLAPNDEATLVTPASGPRRDEVTLAPRRPHLADDLTLVPGAAAESNRRPPAFQPEDATLDGSFPITTDDLTLAPARDGVGEFETLVSRPSPPTAAEAASPTRPTGLRWPSPTQDFEQVRAVFRQLAEGVSALHQAGKLHRDLKPGNVVVRANGQVLLLDFGLVADLVAETNSPSSKQALPPGHELHFASSDRHVLGTVAYMSPEQAAAQPLSPATDWYAMGVMLFQSLTGILPFMGRPREVLDRKQVEPAPAPADLCEGVPEDLNALCVDLLQTDPTRRPSGPLVLARLASEAGTAPANDRFSTVSGVLPFIGRQRELTRLEQLYDQARQGRTVICRVQGRSGTGKSAVLRHFLDRVAASHQPLVLAGHCYEQESVPYKALDSVVDALTRHLLRLPPDRLIPLLPEEIGALTRIFPVLNRVPAIAATAAAGDEISDRRELRRHAFQALRELLARLAARQGLIVYIDDLHWGDVDSVELLSELFRPPGAPAFMLLLAYRSEYAQQSACLKDFEQAEALVRLTHICEEITIEPLSVTETTELSLTLLGTDTPETRRQAEWVTRESGGGAFFIYELVRAIKSGLAVTLTGTAVVLDDVLWSRVQGLPANSRVLLESVAVAGKPVVLRHVQKAVKLAALPPQLIFSLRSGHLVRTSGPNLDDDIETFHDRVRECVVRRLPADSLREHHGSLAVTLEDTGQADPETLAAHFEGAGGNAKASRYFSAAAASALQVLAFDRAEAFFKKAAALCTDPMERAGIHERMIHFYTDMARFKEAYALLRVAVQPFGIKLPRGFIPPLFIADFLRSKFLIRGRAATALSDLPVMNNPGLQMAVRLINAGAKAAYQVRPELCVAISTRAVNLCLAHGNTPDSAVCWMVYGAIFQGGVMGNHPVGFDYGRLALQLVEKFNNAAQRAEVNFVVGYFGTSWLRPVREAEALWATAHQAGLATRDLFHTGCACAGTIMSWHMRGVPFEEIWAESERNLEFLRRVNLREPMGVIQCVRQSIRNLRGETLSATSFSDGTFNEEEFRGQLRQFGSRHFAHCYFITKLSTLYLQGEHAEAESVAQASAAYLKESPGMLHSAEHHFWRGLNSAALARKSAGFARWKLLRTTRAAHRRFTRWAARSPDNFLAKERLLAAEVAGAAGKSALAVQTLTEAVAAAEQYGYQQVQALAYTLLARRYHQAADAGTSAALARATACWRTLGAATYADSLPIRLARS